MIGGATDARNGGEWSVEEANDRADLDPRVCLGQGIATVLAAPRLDVTRAAQLGEDLFEELDGQFFLGGEFADLEDGPAEFPGNAEVNERSECIFASFRKVHLYC